MTEFTFEPKERVSETKPFLIVHGKAGLGKTTFASQAPNPIFIQTEDGGGELNLKTLKDGVFKSFDEVIAGLRYLYANPNLFETLVIDSLDHLEPLVMQKTLDELDIKHLSDAPYGKAYQQMDDNWRKIINGCQKIVKDHNKMFIGIAHSVVRTVNDPTVEPYDSFEMKLGKRAGPIWVETADMIVFINNPVVVDDKTGRPKGGSSVAAYTRPSAAYEAKTRYHSMPGMIQLTRDESFNKVGQYIPTI